MLLIGHPEHALTSEAAGQIPSIDSTQALKATLCPRFLNAPAENQEINGDHQTKKTDDPPDHEKRPKPELKLRLPDCCIHGRVAGRLGIAGRTQLLPTVYSICL
jgi:hypothetical protein